MTKFACVLTLAVIMTHGLPLAAQVQTDVPPIVPGAKAVAIEHIKVHAAA
jgi:hypothetical protein